MSTPSRVTRSSSRNPERPFARGISPADGSAKKGSTKKKSATAAGSSSKKKKSTADSPRASSSSQKKKADSRQATPAGSTKKARRSSATEDEPVVARVASKVAAAIAPVRHTADADVHEATPLVALIPHVGLYALVAALTHAIVIFGNSKDSLKSDLAAVISCATFGVLKKDSILNWAVFAQSHQIAAWVVVPLYLLAGMLLQQGVRHVLGGSRGGGASALACNLARVVSAGLFIATNCAYSCGGFRNSYESVNALVILLFAFMFQEFLLYFSRFSGARVLYSLLYLSLTGYLSYQAYHFQSHVWTSPQAPVFLVALLYAIIIVNISDNLAALAGVSSGLGCRGTAGVFNTLQQIVNCAGLPILAVALFQRHGMLFPEESELKQPAFIDSAAASFVAVGLIFLLIIDSYLVPTVTRLQIKQKRA